MFAEEINATINKLKSPKFLQKAVNPLLPLLFPWSTCSIVYVM